MKSNTYAPTKISGIQCKIDDQGRYCLNDIQSAALKQGLPVERKTPSEWKRHAPAKQYIDYVKSDNCPKLVTGSPASKNDKYEVVTSQKGRGITGTYAHELIALEYARWLSPEFAVRVNKTFLRLVRGDLQGAIALVRDSLAKEFKAMNDALVENRTRLGKETTQNHFNNEARLICLVVTGVMPKEANTLLITDDWRSKLPHTAMAALADIEACNCDLLKLDKPYHERKAILLERFKHVPSLVFAND